MAVTHSAHLISSNKPHLASNQSFFTEPLPPRNVFMNCFSLPRTLRLSAFALTSALLTGPLPSQAGELEGKLLYETYCISCHTTQVHWRQNRLATDWITLKAQVDRWQLTIGQNWNFQQIDDVAKHLNALFYKFDPANESRTEMKQESGSTTESIARSR